MTTPTAPPRTGASDGPFVLLHVPALEDAQPGEVLPLDDDTDHHLRRVLRLDDGDAVEVSDGRGRVAAARLRDDGVRLVGAPTSRPAPSPRISVLQGLPKGRAIEEVVRTLTEVGVARITPVETDHAVRTLTGDKRARRRDRWESIARSACEQARRARRPVVDPTLSLDEALGVVDGPLIVADVGAPRPLRPVLEELRDPACVTVAVGPEGGWSDPEVERLDAVPGARRVRLGPTVLRTEHAAAVVVGAVACELGWFG